MSEIAKAFRELRKLGYVANRHFWCCNSCAWSDLSDEEAKKAVFLHSQAEDTWRERGYTYLAWDGEGQEIFKVLEESGLRPVWDGTNATKFKIHKAEYPQELITNE